MTLDNITGITKVSYTGSDLFCKSQLITCNRVKECNGVCPFEDALKHADQMQTMNEQHVIDHDRDWIIGCIQHDGFIHTDRFDKANQIILEAVQGWIPVSSIRKLQDILLMKIDSFEGTRNIVEKGMLEAWKDVAEYIDEMLGEGGDDE